ncbi:MAG: superoxide dismutase family protein [Enhydrobacter sp.]|nr:MAG: superoxide dismutase family protein [Enhydrobacter sp.]
MHASRWIVAFCFVGLSTVAAQAQTAKAALRDAAGKDVGNVVLVQAPQGVLIRLTLKGAPAGERAFHIHAVGKCEPPFTSAGPHFNPDDKKHGAHAGDMPNLHIPETGDLFVELVNPAITLAKGAANSVFDADGSSIVIHAGPDDYKTDPAGNAGDRIICGVITE